MNGRRVGLYSLLVIDVEGIDLLSHDLLRILALNIYESEEHHQKKYIANEAMTKESETPLLSKNGKRKKWQKNRRITIKGKRIGYLLVLVLLEASNLSLKDSFDLGNVLLLLFELDLASLLRI